VPPSKERCAPVKTRPGYPIETKLLQLLHSPAPPAPPAPPAYSDDYERRGARASPMCLNRGGAPPPLEINSYLFPCPRNLLRIVKTLPVTSCKA